MNRLPPGLIGAALLFWGWQTESIPLAIVLALLLEWLPLTGKRFAIAESAFARIVDVSVVVFVVFALVRIVTGDPAAGLLGAVRLGPLLLAPLLLAQRMSDVGVVRLSALLIAMRMARDRADLPDPALDVAPFYFAATLLCAGAGNGRSPWFFAAAAALVLVALWFVRARARGAAPWLLLAGAAAAAGYAGQSGLNQLQTRVEAASVELIGDWLQRRDPYRSTTDIGHIGELKQSGAVMLRVHADARASVPHLFHVASYNAYAQGAWLARNAPMKPVGVTGGELDLILGAPGAPGAIAIFDVSLPLARGKALLALPPQSTRVGGLRAGNDGAILEANRLGSAQIELAARTLRMQVTAGVAGGLGAPLYGSPDAADLAIPRSELAVIGEFARAAGLIGVTPVEAINRLTRHFGREFSYATYREKPPEGTSPIADFLRRTKAGHCEYFATATVLLLRAAGIPARYATGYAVYEYSTRENAYVVRERHAHSWARAFVDGRWHDVDTTPPDWQRIEAERAGLFQPLADWLRFAWHALTEMGAEALAPWVAAVLALILAVIGFSQWKGRVRASPSRRHPARVTDGRLRAAFRKVEGALHGTPRPLHLPVVAWALLVAPNLRHGDELVELARAYARARFDPSVVAGEAQAGLALRCEALAARLRNDESESRP